MPARPHKLPLRRRLPNPPPAFVGRERALARLADAIKRGPVSLVHGPGGVGKTSLVLQTLHRRFPRRVDKTLFVAIRPDEAAAEVRSRILRVLADAEEDASVDVGAVDADPEAAVATAIELAEDGKWWVVLDDLHHSDPSEMDELVVQLASYARTSRWIVTSRAPPPSGALPGQTLSLDGLDEAELGALAAALEPDLSDAVRARAVRAAAGSPWLLLSHLAAGADGAALERDRLLGSLPPGSADLLRLLAVVPVPLAPELAARVTPLPDEAALAALERRGAIELGPDGLRLHDVVRGLLVTDEPSVARELEAWRARACEALAAIDDVEARLLAAHLAAALGRHAVLEALLDAHGEAILAAGHAPRLWRALLAAPRTQLRRWRLRCAAELGNPTALSEVEPPGGDDPASVRAWAEALVARGEPAEAERVLAGLRDPAARALAARCRLLLGDPSGALERLEGLESQESLRARCALAAGREVVEPTGPDEEGAVDAAEVLLVLGRDAEAAARLDAWLGSARGRQHRLLDTRQALLARARLHLRRGELAAVAEITDTVRPFVRGASVSRPELTALEVERRLAVGELGGLAARLERAFDAAAGVDERARLRLATLSVRLLTAQATTVDDWHEAERARDAPAGRALDAALLESRARAGELTSTELRRALGEPVAGERLRTARLRALAELLAGDPDAAAAGAAAVATSARRAARADVLAEALALRCDALLCADRLEELADAAGELAELGHRTGSARWQSEAVFHTLRNDPGTLERLADAIDVAPVCARRARVRLGSVARLDRVDHLVLEALARGRDAIEVRPVWGAAESRGPWQPGWGLASDGSAWLEDGRRVDLAGHAVLLRLLSVLFDRGGAASKETLIQEAWDEREYHPLRHDPKLHAAVRKLREKLEDRPSDPQRILTTDEGYRLGGVARRAAIARRV